VKLPDLNVPALLRQYGLRPDKRLGQNFLIDSAALGRVVEAAGVTASDTVLEIGPGLGGLTRYLALAANKVIAVELDGRLLPALAQVLAPYPNVRVVKGDILGFKPADLIVPGANANASPVETYRVVANIPYYITSALIRHLLEAEIRPICMVLTVQQEVAERICAIPGDMNLLALSVQVYGRPMIAASIPAGAFYPAPNVDSAVVRVDLYNQPVIPASRLDDFFRLAKAGFSQKRKTLRNSVSGGMRWPKTKTEQILQSAGIEPIRRAETLSLDEWSLLTEKMVSAQV
jgi:16S rRNA (adenine1518-N6/adenine1519-N6)-dimethyltransferase